MPTPLERLLAQARQPGDGPIHLGLERIRALLAARGDPQRNLACIQVAGTNGKGSTLAFLKATLQAAGVPTGVYSSPHLSRFNERIAFNDRLISDAELAPLLDAALAADPQRRATFFELTTAIAFDFFERMRRDCPSQASEPAFLLETGLGGRLDATTAAKPRLCLISAIGHDHQAYLGETLPEIAAEKAGILKPGVPAAADPGPWEAVEVIRARAKAVGAPLWLYGEDYFFERLAGGEAEQPAPWGSAWRYRDPLGELILPAPGLIGDHQYHNAALAIAGLRLAGLRLAGLQHPERKLPWRIEAAHMAAGVAAAGLPGRLERFPGSPEIWLDGAHNAEAARALAVALDALAPPPRRLLFTALNDKNAPAMVAALAPGTRAVHIPPLPGPRGSDPASLQRLWADQGAAAHIEPDVGQALTAARRACGPGEALLVTGSLHLVGAVRSLLA